MSGYRVFDTKHDTNPLVTPNRFLSAAPATYTPLKTVHLRATVKVKILKKSARYSVLWIHILQSCLLKNHIETAHLR